MRLRRVLTLTIIVLIFGIIVSYEIYNNREIYKIQSRIKNIEAANKDKDAKYETIGWIRVQGTKLDIPILFSNNMDEEFPVEMENYFWSENTDDKMHNNIMAVGHNIFNLSSKPKKHDEKFRRVEELMAFVYYDFAKENEYIQLTIDGKEYLYKIFAVSFVDVSTETFLPKQNEMTKEKFVDMKKILENNSIYKYDVDINENDKFISLATCTRFFVDDFETTYYVHGRLLRKGEKPIRYEVKKSKKYKELEKVWEEYEDEEDSL